MFTQQLTDQMRQFIHDLKLERRRKQTAAAKSRAINCMELEDRILLSATPIAPETLVNKNTAEVQQTATQSTQSVAADAQGNHVVVWSSLNQDGSGWDVHAQRFNAAGVAQGDDFQVNTHTQHDQKEAQVSMRDDGTFVITWTDSDSSTPGSADLYARSYNADGTPTKNEETLVTELSDGEQTGPTPGDQKFSAVTMNNNGFFVSWTSQNSEGKWDLFGRWFDAQGDAVNPQFQINTTSSEAAIQSQVGMDPWGYVMVVWQNQDSSGNQDIYGRFGSFANGDSWDTGEYQLNTITAGNQYNPHLGFKSNDGFFVVSWTSDNPDGGSDIYARRYDWYGNPINGDPEFRVNTTTGIAHDNSSVTVDDNTGNFLVTWSSYNQDAFGGWGVYSRSYRADGTPATTETQVNSTIAGSQNYSSAAYLNSNSYVITWSGNGTGDDSGVFSEIGHTGLWGTYFNDSKRGKSRFHQRQYRFARPRRAPHLSMAGRGR